jgi:hypothetical protein
MMILIENRLGIGKGIKFNPLSHIMPQLVVQNAPKTQFGGFWQVSFSAI